MTLNPVSYATAFSATLHPSQLRCILLSNAASFSAMLHPTGLRLTLKELRGTLKILCPLSIAASLILTAKLIMCKENPAKYPSLEKNPPVYSIVQQSNCRWHPLLRKESRSNLFSLFSYLRTILSSVMFVLLACIKRL
jgi:hypothetical protein